MLIPPIWIQRRAPLMTGAIAPVNGSSGISRRAAVAPMSGHAAVRHQR